MKLAIIAAIAKNRVIGKDGKLPWHIPGDLQRFKQLTTGGVVLMGRKTFEGIGRPLPNRRNIVVTSTPIPNVETYSSIEDALNVLANEERVFVIGGGQVFARCLDRADELFLTLVEGSPDGDTLFPPYEELLTATFHPTYTERHAGFVFTDYVRNE
ncbi:MAG: dihydrofolate reductase [Bacteroidetes bacterium]|nr:dihydrofolate reductase [Bacteroidota bacterium]